MVWLPRGLLALLLMALVATLSQSCRVGPFGNPDGVRASAYRSTLDQRTRAVQSADAAAVAACVTPSATCRQALNGLEIQSRALNEAMVSPAPGCLSSAANELGRAGRDYMQGSIEALDDFDVGKPGWANGFMLIASARNELLNGQSQLKRSVCTP